MTMRFRLFVAAVALVIGMAMAGHVYAEPGNGHGRGHGNPHEQGDDNGSMSEHGHGHEGKHHDKHGGKKGKHSIEMSDRDALKGYLRDNYAPKNCPPGLAKKHNGCLPPGQAKKYRVGHVLPETVEIHELPQELLARLVPVPGCRYVQVDQDVLLIGEATKKVVDAVTLLSAVK